MKAYRVIIAGILLTSAGTIAAAEWTDHHTHDPGYASPKEASADLNQVIALGATRPDTAAFADAWTRWLKAHPEADIDETIDAVVTRAMSVASMSAIARDPTTPARKPSRERLAAHMHRLAASAATTTR
jgi:hypothetical protein